MTSGDDYVHSLLGLLCMEWLCHEVVEKLGLLLKCCMEASEGLFREMF